MDEHEWLVSDNPQAMLRYLTREDTPPITSVLHFEEEDSDHVQKRQVPLISDRKLRLFACACCRMNGRAPFVVDEYEVSGAPTDDYGESQYSDLVWAMEWAESSGKYSNKIPFQSDKANILREIVGNPFRRDHNHVPYHKANEWFTPTVTRIAQSIYDNRTFEDMPILGDALEESGCTNEEILRHCRQEERCPYCLESPGYDKAIRDRCSACRPSTDIQHGWIPKRSPCVRGCWVLDLILGNDTSD